MTDDDALFPVINTPECPTRAHPNTPSPNLTDAQCDAAARMARRHARDDTEAHMFLTQLGVEGR